MKTKILILLTIALTILSTSSCSTSKSGSHSTNAYQIPKTKIKSLNEYDLDVSTEGVSYTIDISTPEGKTKLNGLSLREAEELALTEAVIKYNCALLVNPQYTNLMNGKRVLRITVYGFPAKYKSIGNY
ncbi:MAG: hypothetical protein IJZ17_06270 [Muribaculaceae bacterium]|nr:hypothetical protein [Muribaculaceae bacterium]